MCFHIDGNLDSMHWFLPVFRSISLSTFFLIWWFFVLHDDELSIGVTIVYNKGPIEGLNFWILICFKVIEDCFLLAKSARSDKLLPDVKVSAYGI